jgi:hypothetical protein
MPGDNKSGEAFLKAPGRAVSESGNFESCESSRTFMNRGRCDRAQVAVRKKKTNTNQMVV